MTRINLISPKHLTIRHLVAEWKEITQFLHIVKHRVDTNHTMNDIPSQFTLNKGHCLFFANKGLYIYNRFESLYNELLNRDINVNYGLFLERQQKIIQSYNSELFRDYIPQSRDYAIVIDRIKERIETKPNLYPDKDRFFDNIHQYI